MIVAYFVTCVPREKPDGPGHILGPFPTHELAAADITHAEHEAGAACDNAHVIIAGSGGRIVKNSNTPAGHIARFLYARGQYELPDGITRQLRARIMHNDAERMLKIARTNCPCCKPYVQPNMISFARTEQHA